MDAGTYGIEHGTRVAGDAAGSVPVSLLLVEDSPGDASLVTAALADAGGFTVRWVETLGAALAALADGDYDCLVVDLGLPDASGLEVVDALLTPAGDAALVVLTGNDDEASALTAIKEGVDDYLVKSDISVHGLRRSLQYAIERAKLTGHLRRAEQSARTLSTIVESTGDAIFAMDASGLITAWNRAAEELYGYTAEEAVGRHVRVLHPLGEEDLPATLDGSSGGRTVRGLETVRRTRAGRLIDVSLTVSPLSEPDGRLIGASVIARDISERLLLEGQLKDQATHDALTGLPNRALLSERLSQALAVSASPGHPVTVLFLDLDSFKTVNDARGHLAGDGLLREVAKRLQGVVRSADTVARLGGDEFVIVCPDTDSAAAQRLAERVTEVIAAPVRINADVVHVTASIGVAIAPPLEADAESLLRHADAAMYEAKARGRARTQLFDVAFAERSRHRLELADDLRTALRDGQLEVHYQPVLDIATGRPVGVEALTRWRHPERGWVPPATFVPLAEDTGIVGELDRWVLRQACRDAVVLNVLGLLDADARMSVNLSPRTLGEPDLVEYIRRTTAAEQLPVETLVLEVTETAVMNDVLTARRSLEALRELGVGVALDDFGTGYSSLSLLRQLPVSRLKIDRSFVRNLGERSDDLAIAASIINLARALGMETGAEGIEFLEQRRLLDQLGCPLGQGFLWSKALPLGELIALLGQQAVNGAAVAPASPDAAALDLAAPDCGTGHSVWFYRDQAALETRLQHAMSAALRSGDACLLIASALRRESLQTALGDVLTEPQAWGRYLELDSDVVLDLVAAGADGLSGCGKELTRLLARLGAPARTVRVFSDLGPMIWSRSGAEAVALEGVWDQLRGNHDLDVLCAYDLGREWSPSPSDLAGRHDDAAWVCAPVTTVLTVP
ncbi:MAG TPA: EAL domain-containing protein [Nocardioidaceae bacterium]|nr:EAL domain-containing protein [Nocardioidaceae bacterium]